MSGIAHSKEHGFLHPGKIVLEENRIKLSKAEWDRFSAKMEEPPKDLPELHSLFSAISIFVES